MSRTVPVRILQAGFTHASAGISRRRFLRSSLVAAAGLALPWTGCSSTDSGRVAIVGAGLAGLSAAYTFQKEGITCDVYEASGRAGGRMLTSHDAVIDGAHVDFGAEYIDTNHHALLDLARELKVPVMDLRSDQLTSKVFFFDGKHRTEEELVDALTPFADRIMQDLEALPAELHYRNADTFRYLDQMSITEYLRKLGVKGWLYDFFDMALTGEFAMEASEQSALNLLLILSVPIQFNEHYHLLGEHHEVLKFTHGSQSLTDALAVKVNKDIHFGYTLSTLNRHDSGYELTFGTAEGDKVVLADTVLLTLPFTALRDVRRNFQFSDRKERCIRELGFGNASKVAMGFTARPWREQGYQGYTFTDINQTVIWDSSQGQPVEGGSLSFIGGGKSSDEFLALPYDAIKERWLHGAEKIFPGVVESYNGRIAKFCWAINPFIKGSYTSYRVGQWSEFFGVEGEPFEGIWFAGEHCSMEHQGFMNGAAETGVRAAREILQSIQQHTQL